MLPLYLSIEGLYSYQHKQEIDFTKLTEAGLFGIFGNVGSGKSSILEAISFALYGETERLNKQEKRTYNMLNLKSDAAYIVFEFLNFQNRHFRFVTQWKRKKKFEETTTIERLAYELKDGQWLPLDSADGAKYTNLSYPNFRRTIIIPQGQFKEFLELKGKDRSDMMKEIFNLDRFDLGPKVSFMQRQNNSKIEHIKGALSGFEAISPELLEQKMTDLKQALTDLNSLKNEVTKLEEECRILNEGKKLRLDIQARQAERDELLKEKPRIEKLEKELHIYETTDRAFREILSDTQRINKEKETTTLRIEQLSVNKEKALQDIAQKETTWAAIAEEFKHLDQYKAEIEDIKLLITICQNTIEKNILEKRISDGKPFLEKVKQEEKTLLDRINEQENKLELLKAKKTDTTVLLALENWYQNNDLLQQQAQELAAQELALNKDINTLLAEFNTANLTLENWEQKLQESEQKWLKQQLQLLEEQTQLKVNEKLAEFSDSLQSGEACPLCGSKDHPSPMHIHDLARQKAVLSDKLMKVQQELEYNKRQTSQLTKTGILIKEKKNTLNLLQQAQTENINKQNQQQQNFSWKDFSPLDKTAFFNYKVQGQETEKIIQQIESEIKTLRLNHQEAFLKVEKYEKSINDFEQNLRITLSLINQNQQQLRILKIDQTQNEKTLLEKKEKIQSRIKFLEEQYQTLSSEIQQLKTNLAQINGERGVLKEQFQKLFQQLNYRQSEIAGLLNEHSFEDITQVQSILQKNLNSESLRKAIQEFTVNLNVLLAKISELEQQAAHDNFNEVLYEEKSSTLTFKRNEFELKLGATAALEKEFERLQIEVAKKEKLIEEFTLLDLRKKNLTTLENLFRGSGFVNYVSSIHLQRLCEIANERFHRLTKNNLSLTINDSNEFEVVDFLHNGYRRSVKTLSGGQSFQASLCLALALAENIQIINKADKNFFFIDEGFGTLDADSMNTVFETLQYLHKENRIVGIISHVEELKERIPKSITIMNDAEHGSRIHVNE
ncbi:AAA family ATPase [Sphingobacterium sp. UT-1RO-CII-1]|uniref:AAA family ATPase n=1 Tax=Sphingobacterium sp. UT-1RO-CII-1 TaxID=2995225 RepID=UPI00227B1A18|nr:AAA family ATPase [Sphingobacterium sp. UT-1RO-CII-1]MCY4780560.1 AAA family ATPase [Sphingobacterium sp. UT-1RO-CII-1]